MSQAFNPPFYLKNAFVQTLLASNKLGTQRNNPMLNAAREVLLNPIPNVTLQGFYSPHPQAKGVVMLLHGWEGSVNSAYVLRTGKFLYEHGYSVFRLNYRDHGDTHHLNPGLFYAILLDEVFASVQAVAGYETHKPYFLLGFSMGGNFALRVARKCAAQPIPNLKHIFSISPVLDPEKSTVAIDQHPMLKKYFRRGWSRSLLKKQSLYPQLYNFDEGFKYNNLMAMTEWMLQHYSEYPIMRDYFRQYALLNDALTALNVPTTIITAQDDPVIPIADFYDLKLSPTTELIIHPHGGHNGFFETLSGRLWYQKKILSTLIYADC
ncbi:MAG: alpha/beta fold hydrolase [Anaerolineae bacterium]|nr:alpha/beta fold hydrolase [Anaerolineae bacterium]